MRVTLSKPFSDTKRLTKALGATLISGELPPVLRGIATDSREVRRGDLFVALHGQRVEGSEYLEQARRQGALALLVPQGTPIPADIACLTVDDTEAALLRAARERRRQAKAFVIAVSGSCGKTTVKEAVATLLSSRGRTERSRANFNSQIGMPLSLLSMEDCAHWVLELGINHIGEMEKMAAAVAPDLALLTNVGTAHIGQFGTYSTLLAEKAKIAVSLASGGRVLAPASLPQEAFPCSAGQIFTFGKGGFFHLENIRYSKRGTVGDLFCPDRVITNLVWPIAGQVGAATLEAVGALGVLLGLDANTIRAGLLQAGESTPRLALSMAGDRLLIDDAYNASPEAMLAALETLTLTAGRRPTVAVLGDMLELGRYARAFHYAVGRAVSERGIDYLFTYGTEGLEIAAGARDAGMACDRIFCFEEGEREALANTLCRTTPQDAALLFKASGKMALSRIANEVRRRLS